MLAVCDGRWSLPSSFAATKVHDGYQRVVVVHAGRVVVPELGWLVDEFAPVAECWVSRLAAGGFIAPHVDAGPYRERWQVPVTGAGSFNGARPTPGVPFRVCHWEWHEVRNDDATPRVTVVVDRDVLVGVPSGPLKVR